MPMARTAGRASWGIVVGIGVLALARPACGPPEGKAPTDDTLTAVLAQTGPGAVEPALALAASSADELIDAANAWAAAPDDATAAQDAWRATMAAWQRVEVMQIGPLGSSLTVLGGQDIRDQVYSWPTVNPCAVDQQTVAGEWVQPDFFATHLVNVYGLAALETLLFSPAGENVCPSQVDINASGSWDALGPAAIQQNRADYAVVLAAGVAERIRFAQSEWTAYEAEFESGGQDSLNAIFDALFYIETRTKDDKLGGPIGRYDCGATSCLGFVETPLAGGSNVWLAENLVGFRALYLGGDGVGLDDLLIANDHADIADAMSAALDVADSAAAAVTEPIGDATPEALALHDALDGVGTLLKSEIAPALVLQVPAEAAGDND